ncbi:hypothetical protein [Rosistilla oblonga]|uniref:Uncharacterized protein n=1 Tax=Rosistilla oblonga TaxID=2527990 RepID=A0A518IZ38_9BACT|nr:hypothetical protein [Rosistilla oblonga]QDV58352.1 hypothetical protein Mal33_43700 [Rosistilla oblonga]
MSNGELIHPRIGPLSILGAITILVLQVVFGMWVLFYYGSPFGQAAWIGLMWLGCSMTASVCFSATFSWRRVLFGGLSFLWHVLFMAICWRETPLRYMLLLGGLLVLQGTFSTILGVPAWHWGRESKAALPTRYRFTIRSILVATTVVAMLLSAARAYELPMVAPQLLAVPLFVLLYLGAASAMLAESHVRIRALCLLAVLLGGSLLYSWIATALVGSTGQSLTLRQFVGSLGSNSLDGFVVQMQMVQFGLFTIGCCLCFGFGRTDDRDFVRRQLWRQESDSAKSTQAV